MKNNLKTMKYSELRSNFLVDLNVHLKTRLILAKKFLDGTNSTDTDIDDGYASELYNASETHIKEAGVKLKKTQDYLNFEAEYLNINQKLDISPTGIILKYKSKSKALPSYYERSLSQIIKEMTISSFRLVTVDYVDLNEDNFSVYMVVENSLNSLFSTIKEATKKLLDHVYKYKGDILLLYFINTCAALGLVLLCQIITIRLVLLIRSNKNQVFSLFLCMTKKDLEKCRAKCEQFKQLNTMVFLIGLL